jgi:indole-3-glycerol phosphate synthase
LSILQEITENKAFEVSRAKTAVKQASLEKSPLFDRNCNSLVDSLKNTPTGIIAEFKRKSPSKGDINIGVGIAETTSGYVNAGAAGLSVLTDSQYFGGFKEDLQIARENSPFTPILRKDFMIDAYQVYEAKAWGADVILLIAACLPPAQIEDLANLAHTLGMEVLLEVHDKEELASSPIALVDIIGVNNRNLKNFNESNINASLELSDLISSDKLKISESCISKPEIVKELKEVGYNGFLIGESFMKDINPGKALSEFLSKC